MAKDCGHHPDLLCGCGGLPEPAGTVDVEALFGVTTKPPAGGVIAQVTAELVAIAAEVKAGTIHEDHDGWDWLYPDRVLRCSCGVALVDPAEARQ